MTPLAQEIFDIIRQRLAARSTAEQAGARNAVLIVTTQLEQLDAEWNRNEYWHARRIKESNSRAWTESLENSHAVRLRAYSQTRADFSPTSLAA